MAKDRIKFKLQGHEKFALRDGWLTKGIVNVSKDPKVFQGDDSPDTFGIGTNMVKSLRYWLKAFGLIDIKPGKGAFLTPIGEIIKEYDLYFEDSFTMWVLHSEIAKNIEEATSWYMFFNRCDAEEVTRRQIEQILTKEIQKYALTERFSENSVKNDIDVIINMYTKSKGMVDPEEKNTSPFSVLGILKNNENQFSKVRPQRKTINEWVVLYELAILMKDKNQISIEKAIYEECGLSKIYQLSPIMINDFLDKLDALGYIRIDRTAGLDMIYRVKDFNKISVMKEYYETR